MVISVWYIALSLLAGFVLGDKLHTTTSTCPDGYYLWKGKCERKQQIEPQLLCPAHTIEKGGKCIRYEAGALKCPDNAALVGNSCVFTEESPKTKTCPQNAVERDGICEVSAKSQQQCPESSFLNEDNDCVELVHAALYCEAGFVLNNGICEKEEVEIPISRCPQGSAETGTQCQIIVGGAKEMKCSKGSIDLGDADNCVRYAQYRARCPDGFEKSSHMCTRTTYRTPVKQCLDGGDASDVCHSQVPVELRPTCKKGSFTDGQCIHQESTDAEKRCPEGYEFGADGCSRIIEYDCSETISDIECKDTPPIDAKRLGLMRRLIPKKLKKTGYSLTQNTALPLCHKVSRVVPKRCFTTITAEVQFICPNGLPRADGTCDTQYITRPDLVCPVPHLTNREKCYIEEQSDPFLLCPAGYTMDDKQIMCGKTEVQDEILECPEGYMPLVSPLDQRRLQFNARASRVAIVVVRARDLKDTELFGRPDPYVVVRYGGEKLVTPPQEDTRDPYWNAQFTADYYAVGRISFVSMRVYDSDRITDDDFIGGRVVPLSRLLNHSIPCEWIQLTTLEGRPAGSICARARRLFSTSPHRALGEDNNKSGGHESVILRRYKSTMATTTSNAATTTITTPRGVPFGQDEAQAGTRSGSRFVVKLTVVRGSDLGLPSRPPPNTMAEYTLHNIIDNSDDDSNKNDVELFASRGGSEIVGGDRNPWWGARFTMEYDHQRYETGPIRITVYDVDRFGSRDELGHRDVYLDEILGDECKSLRLRTQDGPSTGHVCVKAQIERVRMPRESEDSDDTIYTNTSSDTHTGTPFEFGETLDSGAVSKFVSEWEIDGGGEQWSDEYIGEREERERDDSNDSSEASDDMSLFKASSGIESAYSLMTMGQAGDDDDGPLHGIYLVQLVVHDAHILEMHHNAVTSDSPSLSSPSSLYVTINGPYHRMETSEVSYTYNGPDPNNNNDNDNNNNDNNSHGDVDGKATWDVSFEFEWNSVLGPDTMELVVNDGSAIIGSADVPVGSTLGGDPQRFDIVKNGEPRGYLTLKISTHLIDSVVTEEDDFVEGYYRSGPHTLVVSSSSPSLSPSSSPLPSSPSRSKVLRVFMVRGRDFASVDGGQLLHDVYGEVELGGRLFRTEGVNGKARGGGGGRGDGGDVDDGTDSDLVWNTVFTVPFEDSADWVSVVIRNGDGTMVGSGEVFMDHVLPVDTCQWTRVSNNNNGSAVGEVCMRSEVVLGSPTPSTTPSSSTTTHSVEEMANMRAMVFKSAMMNSEDKTDEETTERNDADDDDEEGIAKRAHVEDVAPDSPEDNNNSIALNVMLTVVSGRNLPTSSSGRSPNAFVAFRWRDERRSTSTVFNSRDPVWNKSFRLKYSTSDFLNNRLVLRVVNFDAQTSRRDVLGFVRFTSDNGGLYNLSSRRCQYYRLTNREGRRLQGALCLKAVFSAPSSLRPSMVSSAESLLPAKIHIDRHTDSRMVEGYEYVNHGEAVPVSSSGCDGGEKHEGVSHQFDLDQLRNDMRSVIQLGGGKVAAPFYVLYVEYAQLKHYGESNNHDNNNKEEEAEDNESPRYHIDATEGSVLLQTPEESAIQGHIAFDRKFYMTGSPGMMRMTLFDSNHDEVGSVAVDVSRLPESDCKVLELSNDIGYVCIRSEAGLRILSQHDYSLNNNNNNNSNNIGELETSESSQEEALEGFGFFAHLHKKYTISPPTISDYLPFHTHSSTAHITKSSPLPCSKLVPKVCVHPDCRHTVEHRVTLECPVGYTKEPHAHKWSHIYPFTHPDEFMCTRRAMVKPTIRCAPGQQQHDTIPQMCVLRRPAIQPMMQSVIPADQQCPPGFSDVGEVCLKKAISPAEVVCGDGLELSEDTQQCYRSVPKETVCPKGSETHKGECWVFSRVEPVQVETVVAEN